MTQNEKQNIEEKTLAQNKVREALARYENARDKYTLMTSKGITKIKKAFYAWDKAFDEFQKVLKNQDQKLF